MGSAVNMSEDEDFSFKINKNYAEKYNRWREKEEYEKLKARYGDVEDSEPSSSGSEEEDEDADELTPRLEKDWLKTLAALKSKDPRIYDKEAKFYQSDDEDSGNKKEKKKKEKPMYLKDFERKVILEKDGKLEDSDDEIEQKYQGISYYEEQDQLKKSLVEAAGGNDDDDDSDDDLLTRRNKTKEEKEEQEYIAWLKSQPKDDQPQAGLEELVPLKEYWSDPKLGEGEKFLRDFILNKRYLDDEDEDRIPTYDEIVNDDEENFSEEEKQLEKEEKFEQKYNFRFEEPDEEFIKSFPRTIGDSVRRKDTKRAEKRREVQERKEQEKKKKKEEIAQLKRLKKKEIQSKLDRIKEIT